MAAVCLKHWTEESSCVLWQAGCICFYVSILFLREREREKQSVSGGGAERGGDTESEAGSRLWAVSTEPDAGLELANCEIVTWAKVGRSTDWATQVPQAGCVFKILSTCWLYLFFTLFLILIYVSDIKRLSEKKITHWQHLFQSLLSGLVWRWAPLFCLPLLYSILQLPPNIKL